MPAYVLVYDSAAHSARAGWPESRVMWGLENGTSRPVALHLGGVMYEMLLRLPEADAGVTAEEWGGPRGDAVRQALGALVPCQADFRQMRRMHGYESKKWYVRVRTDTREALDLLKKRSADDPLVQEFAAGPPKWLETNVDPMTKASVTLGWKRAGWFRIKGEAGGSGGAPEPEGVEAVGGQEFSDPPRARPVARGHWTDRDLGREPYHLYVGHGDLESLDDQEAGSLGLHADPRLCAIDIETHRHDLQGFPNPHEVRDITYLVSLVCSGGGRPPTRHCVCVGDPDRGRLAGVRVHAVGSEPEAYRVLGAVLREEDPDVLTGYNIHNYDLSYIETRLALLGLRLPNISRLPAKPSSFCALRGPRGARYTSIDAPGRLVLDAYLYILRNASREDTGLSLAKVSERYLKKAPPAPRALWCWGRGGEGWMAASQPHETALADEAQHVETGAGLEEAGRRALARGGAHPRVDVRGGGAAGKALAAALGRDPPPGTTEVLYEGAAVWRAGGDEGDLAKIALSYREQFALYAAYRNGLDPLGTGLGRVAEYCMRDSDIIPALFGNRAIWSACLQFSSILGCPPQSVATGGQVERLTPLIYRYFRQAGFVFERNPMLDEGKVSFEGGLVELSARGRAQNALIGDFSSLYPSIIEDNNFCLSTRLRPEDAGAFAALGEGGYSLITPSFVLADAGADAGGGGADGWAESECGSEAGEDGGPDEAEAPDAAELAKSLRKAKRAAEEAAKPRTTTQTPDVCYVRAGVQDGVFPRILRNLKAERAHQRKVVKRQHEAAAAEAAAAGDEAGAARQRQLAMDADLRQGAIKVAANSIYGACGSSADFACPFLGMCVTHVGRRCIREATECMRAMPEVGEHIYTDTDSSMLTLRGFGPVDLCAHLYEYGERGPDPAWARDPELPAFVYAAAARTWREWWGGARRIGINWMRTVVNPTCVEVCRRVDRAGIYGERMEFAYEAWIARGIFVSRKFYGMVGTDEDGEPFMKLRGIMLRRADYCDAVKGIYAKVFKGVLYGRPEGEVVAALYDELEAFLVGPEPSFARLQTRTDFKRITDYKDGTAKMAVMARHAEEMGTPLPEYSAVYYVLIRDPGASAVAPRMMTEAMLAAGWAGGLAVDVDRAHYVKILRKQTGDVLAMAGGPGPIDLLMREAGMQAPAAGTEILLPAAELAEAWAASRGPGPEGRSAAPVCGEPWDPEARASYWARALARARAKARAIWA
jgi:DNA polymerase elongation subunit (family B)